MRCAIPAAGWPGNQNAEDWSYCPSVAVMIVGLNEGDTIQHALESVYGTYPRMEIFVVDDGSTDDMAAKANAFAKHHRGVTVLSRKLRGGKSSAMNMPLPLINSEIVVVIDSDSHLAEGAIWRIVQPFKYPEVGAVSGSVAARNPLSISARGYKPLNTVAQFSWVGFCCRDSGSWESSREPWARFENQHSTASEVGMSDPVKTET